MHHAISSFSDLIDLASERLGGAAIACSDDFFAGMDSLVKAKEPVWVEDAYTDRGKWMDGWESRRSHRENHDNAHEDFCIIRLGAPGIIRGVIVDTAFFRGNFPASCALEGITVEGYPLTRDIVARNDWVPLLSKSPLEGNTKNAFDITSPYRFTHVRLRIFPDGGVARLRVYGEPRPDWRMHGGLHGVLELSGAELGGIVEACSDMFFGSRHNLLFPGPSTGMHDGWETRRGRRAGSDWAIVRLAARCRVQRLVVDTSHFKGNCPESFSLEGTSQIDGEHTVWEELFPRTALSPHTRHVFHRDLRNDVDVTHVRVRIYPDGGLARFRLFGTLDDTERAAQRARSLDAMTPEEAEVRLHTCCGSNAWVKHMLAARPFGSAHALAAAVQSAFDAMTTGDWLEAFAAHPRIGGRAVAGHASSQSRALSAQEQALVNQADDDTRHRLAQRNEAYLQRHGFIFIVKATGKSASEMLTLLEERIDNPRDVEIMNAAREQRAITALRLEGIA